MDDNHWVWPDRRDLYGACLALAGPAICVERVGDAADTLLNDLELYDDPRQGQGTWLFPDEIALVDDLATKLHTVIREEPAGGWGSSIIAHTLWQGICSDAQNLLAVIRRNGQGSASFIR
ncbi:MAG: hypothetical protein IT550_07630 [Novosphingobium sp.]|nr:hypothetical protein [Novosphingobium sp.]